MCQGKLLLDSVIWFGPKMLYTHTWETSRLFPSDKTQCCIYGDRFHYHNYFEFTFASHPYLRTEAVVIWD